MPMKPTDRTLGMHRNITRRDFMSGAVGSLVAGSVITSGCSQEEAPFPRDPTAPVGSTHQPPPPTSHPPSRLGLRGNHEGSFEVAHDLAFNHRTDWGPATEPDPADYDLVVVGAGISGLAAAYFHREKNPGARVLLLDNHDDFGGHAKRNEFEWNGRTILGYGGSQSLEAPSAYSDVARGLLEEIGVSTKRLEDAYDQQLFRDHDLAAAVYFDRATYGVDRTVRTGLVDPSGFIPMAPPGGSTEETIDQMPLSEPARRELRRLFSATRDEVPDHWIFGEFGYLRSISYTDFLRKHLGVEQPEVFALLQDTTSSYWGHGIDVVPALDAMGFGLPGIGSTSLGSISGLLRRAVSVASEPYVFHFPDGNASVARLLVRRLIPAAADGDTMEELVTASFDYSALDRANSDVRLRLDSTVVRVEHEGDARSAERVGVTYVRDGRTEHVRARKVVLACYNMAIPYLCPELPDAQKQALHSLVKIPLVYTNVLLNNWRAFDEMGLGLAHCPGSWHKLAMLDFPVCLGDYRFGSSPDDPVVLHMNRSMTAPGLTPREQSRAGRHELMGTSFETIEREIRTHLGGMLGGADFDPARDIEAITVNRWPHGYAFEPNPLFDPKYEQGEAPNEIGRQRFGRIAIANSDAAARAYLDSAIDEGWRAVEELSG
jgi:spermidine dehydrogenase